MEQMDTEAEQISPDLFTLSAEDEIRIYGKAAEALNCLLFFETTPN